MVLLLRLALQEFERGLFTAVEHHHRDLSARVPIHRGGELRIGLTDFEFRLGNLAECGADVGALFLVAADQQDSQHAAFSFRSFLQHFTSSNWSSTGAAELRQAWSTDGCGSLPASSEVHPS